MNLSYTIMKQFGDATYEVTFVITEYHQRCVYDKDNKKYYEVSIYFDDNNHNWSEEFYLREEQPLFFSEVYNKWCERCHQVLKEHDSFKWWFSEGLCDIDYEKYDKIIKETFCK